MPTVEQVRQLVDAQRLREVLTAIGDSDDVDLLFYKAFCLANLDERPDEAMRCCEI